MRFRILSALFYFDVFYLDLIISALSGLFIDKMANNQEQLRHDIVSHHAFVRRERAWPRDLRLVWVHLVRMCPLLEFRCLRLRLLRGKCHPLLPRKPYKSMLMHLLLMLSFLMFLSNYEEASMVLHYCLCMQNILDRSKVQMTKS